MCWRHHPCMQYAKANQMIEIIENAPANVSAFRAKGHVTADDYKRLVVPVIDKQVEELGKINFLLELDTSLSEFTIGALLQDLGVGLKHFTKWHKMAIVSNSPAIKGFTDVFSYVAPGEAKGFSHEEIGKAMAWVSS